MCMKEYENFLQELRLSNYFFDILKQDGWNGMGVEMGKSNDGNHAFYFTAIKNNHLISPIIECEIHRITISYGLEDNPLEEKQSPLSELSKASEFSKKLMENPN